MRVIIHDLFSFSKMSMQEPAVEINGFESFVNGGVPSTNIEKILILSNLGHTAAFQISNEDHTLGNLLRFIIMKNPKVEFCGYTIPHPSEYVMNLRIQTGRGYSAVEAFNKGIEDLKQMLMHIKNVSSDKLV